MLLQSIMSQAVSPDLLLRRPGFNTKVVCVKFMASKVAVGG